MNDATDKVRAREWAARVAYGDRMLSVRPPRAPLPPSEDEESANAAWLWAMAQPLVGLDRQQAQQFAEQFDLRVLERPISPNLMIYGEAYSAPGTIAVQYDDGDWRGPGRKPPGIAVRVAVEGVWPNQ